VDSSKDRARDRDGMGHPGCTRRAVGRRCGRGRPGRESFCARNHGPRCRSAVRSVRLVGSSGCGAVGDSGGLVDRGRGNLGLRREGTGASADPKPRAQEQGTDGGQPGPGPGDTSTGRCPSRAVPVGFFGHDSSWCAYSLFVDRARARARAERRTIGGFVFAVPLLRLQTAFK
jgi:hypothetical protein